MYIQLAIKIFRERKLTTKSKEINIQNLLPGKTYSFRVVANKISNSRQIQGESSAIKEVSTQTEENICGPPQNLEGIVLSHQQIYLKWDPPLVPLGEILKYRVYYAEIESGEEHFADCAASSREMILTELAPYMEFAIFVVGKFYKRNAKDMQIVNVIYFCSFQCSWHGRSFGGNFA